MRTNVFGTAVLIFFLLALGQAQAGAQSQTDAKAEARQHFNRALELVEEEAYQEAAVEFQKAYEISPHFSVLYNLGMAYVTLGRPVEAVDALSRYLREGGKAIAAQRRVEVQEEIDRQSARISYLTLTVIPDGAAVKVDDKDLGQSPVAEPVRVGVGIHAIVVSLDGYQTYEASVTVAGEERKTVEVELKLNPMPVEVKTEPVGQMDVRCPLPDVRIEVDGQLAGQTPLSAPLLAPLGAHQVRFTRPGYIESERTVTVQAGPMAPTDCGLKPESPLAASAAAILEVEASEPDASAFLDGSALPLPGRVPFGRHMIEVRRAGFKAWKSEIALKAGENMTIEARLVPETDFLRDYKSSANMRRIWAYAAGGTGIAFGAASTIVFFWNDGRFGKWKTEKDKLDLLYSQTSPLPDDIDKRQTKNDNLLRSIQDWDAATIGMAVAGATLLTAGIVLFFSGDNPSKYDDIMLKADQSSAAIEWRAKW